jgi:hypothetical protein
MEASQVPTQGLALRSGLLLAACLTAYFLLMKVLGFVEIQGLRVLNIFIVFAVLVYTIRTYRLRAGSTVVYLEGIALGFYTVAIGAVVFAIFLFIYLRLLDHALYEHLKANAPMINDYFSPLLASITVMAELMIAGLILSFALMQYYKNDNKHS